MNLRLILIRFRQSKFFPIAVILLFACLLEITIFNCKHWSSFFAKKSDSYKVEYGSAFIKQNDGTFLIGEGDQTIDFSDINVVLKSSLINIDIVKGDEGRFYAIPIWQAVTDFSHDEFYGIGERVIYPDLKRSEYLLYHLYGEAHELRIGLNIPVGTVISVDTELNPHVPIMFSFKRFIWVVLFLLFMYVFRPSSGLYRITYLKIPYKVLLLILILFFVFNASVFNYLSNVNPFFQWERGDSQEQYQLLADAIKGGKFSLDIEVPQILKNLDNPYDRIQRERAFEGTGQWYRWDHAYYKGKYYVYFGVVPVLVFYLPALLITGIQLSNHTAVFFASLLLLLGILGTIHEFIKKWFPKLSLGMWLLLTESLLLGSNTIYMLKRPDLYTVPIITGLAFGFLGLWFFLQSIGKDEIRYNFVAIGSLFTALVAGCRPQLFLMFAFFFVLYSPIIFNKTKLISPEGGKLALELLVPMFAVALFLMLYNFKRFGSPFDFGANYNLNFNDMRYRKWFWGRVPLGLWASLLQPVKIIQNF
nr:hypothetical protein [Lachnospiraceae bacterium]